VKHIFARSLVCAVLVHGSALLALAEKESAAPAAPPAQPAATAPGAGSPPPAPDADAHKQPPAAADADDAAKKAPPAADADDAAKKAPPAAAPSAEAPVPSHGARAKAADGSTVFYDKVRGVYVSPDQHNTFYNADRFYRQVEGIWLSAASSKGPWELAPEESVPESLRDAYLPPKTKVTATLPSGMAVVYEPDLRAYRVTSQEGLFISDGRFYRYTDGIWLSSTKAEGPWELANTKGLSAPLKHRVKPPEAGQKVTLPSGTVLEYDDEVLLFRVAGQGDVYLHDGAFVARREGKWLTSATPDGAFVDLHPARVPPSLKAYYKKKEGPRPVVKKEKPPKPATKEEREALRKEREKIRAEREAARAEREALRREAKTAGNKTRNPNAKAKPSSAAKSKQAAKDKPAKEPRQRKAGADSEE